MNNKLISDRVEALRAWMREEELDAFVVPTGDPHLSEYVPAHWKTREWLTGFTGSAGTAVVTLTEAALWTDSRYWLQAESQLKGTPFVLKKSGDPTTPEISEWLSERLYEFDTVGVDGWTISDDALGKLEEDLDVYGIELETMLSPWNTIWKDRPAMPKDKIEIQPLEYAGQSAKEKIEMLRAYLSIHQFSLMVIGALDEVAWLLNLRGSDVPCNPVFTAYFMVTPKKAWLYVDKAKLTPEVSAYLKETGVTVRPYSQIIKDLKQLKKQYICLPDSLNSRLLDAPSQCHIKLIESPAKVAKAFKNNTEIEGFRQAMLRDGVAMVKFLRWLKPAVKRGGVTEMGVDRKLTALRAEQPLYRGLSFDTIAAYGDHGAIVHYEATPETDRELKPEGFLLLDSGAQYQDGTTDITRTIALGTPTEEEKHVYTLVLKGHIALSRAKFPEDTCGTQLDLAARYAMWQEGYNYGHGTGHGVGSFLNVHEGPHQIRMNHVPATIDPGMTVTDEPGIYLKGRFGVRTENVLLCVEDKKTEFGEFFAFEPLTLCPIDTTPIDKTMLSKAETDWLNDYHRTVREKLMPLLDNEADRKWLEKATKKI